MAASRGCRYPPTFHTTSGFPSCFTGIVALSPITSGASFIQGRAMARCLGWKGHVAWDTYFVYRTGSLWTGVEMPYPDAWFHQLKDREVWEQTAEADLGTAEWTHALAEKSEADPAHFRTGDDLRVALGNALKEAAAAQPITASSASGS